MSFYITRMGGLEDGPFDTYEDAWLRMHSIQPQSVHHAFTWEGWQIEEVGGEGDAPGIPSRRRPEGEAMYEIQATVYDISRKTTGYGDNEKTVGITVKAKFAFEYEVLPGDVGSAIVETTNGTVTFELGLEHRRAFAVGDTVMFAINNE